jgi:hypothetical protein
MSTVQDDRAAPNKNKNKATGKTARSGSETRTHSKKLTVRYPVAQYAELENMASAQGLSLSAFVRLKASGIKPVNATTQDQKLAIQYLAELGKIGSNLNQIARAANMNQAGLRDIAMALDEIHALGLVLRQIVRGSA